uniref:Ribosomal protein L23 n=1 Tax=Eustigmatophyceae sp. Mont 10/10-1w TaxID=2506145 RepID=A0A3R5WWW5_9STRA|nr:ribosomal protein L23 [Eustigmatophyceae sp. Mont 10/10-1w]QAA11666.1 ribosomal protein L23 [Eustigmatophyceae sp. Mont 10/10-1w]
MEVATTKLNEVIKLSKTQESEWIDILKYPLITEKANLLDSKNQYIFVVESKTDKQTIKKAFEYVFSVKVSSVNTMTLPRKKVRRKGIEGYKPRYKKAIIKLAPGYNLEFFGMEKSTLGI